MVKIKITFSDNSSRVYEFSTKEKADWFIHMEGDHVKKVEYL